MHAHPLIAMRKTSRDGIDLTTSGIENEIKKAGKKFKKTSKKSKVQNFILENDENVIEPLLEIDNEKSEISNTSAKYLLNKIKTDSSFELVYKSSENSVFFANSTSTPVGSTSKVNNSYLCGTTRLHNHMNTNIFGMYDVTTKNSIIVEIDGRKSGVYNPSPMIFTTAKIHTDGKSKQMEPVQITHVPILSTIEGNVVRTFADNSEYQMSNFSPRPIDLNINKCGTSVISDLNESEIKNIKEIQTIHPVRDSASTHNKNQNINKATSGETMALKHTQFPIDVHMTDKKSKRFKSPKAISGKQGNVASGRKRMPYIPLSDIIEKHNTLPKNIDFRDFLNDEDIPDKYKASSSGSKKLKRQKNASIEDVNEMANISNTLTNKSDKSLELDKNIVTENENSSVSKDYIKSEDISSNENMTIATKPTTKIDTSTAVSIDSNSLASTISQQEVMSTTDTEVSLPLIDSAVANGSKNLNKSSMIPVHSSKHKNKSVFVPTEKMLCNVEASSVNTSAMATFSKSDSLNLVPTKDDVLVKCETSVVTPTLPSYIVSTSRTKIGSTLTFSTITNTSRSSTQKPLDEVVYTKSGKEKISTASEQGNKAVVSMPSNSTRDDNVSNQTETGSSVKESRA